MEVGMEEENVAEEGAGACGRCTWRQCDKSREDACSAAEPSLHPQQGGPCSPCVCVCACACVCVCVCVCVRAHVGTLRWLKYIFEYRYFWVRNRFSAANVYFG